MTLHKIQGQTCQKIILDLNKRPSQPHMNFSGLYVGLSRIRKSSDLRLMPLQAQSTGLQHLKTLAPNNDLLEWHTGFSVDTGHGKFWQAERVQANKKEKRKTTKRTTTSDTTQDKSYIILACTSGKLSYSVLP